MFLKSLTIKGFKSFADATTLELETGITAVVGPNGSGKSNVVDSVAWVLGAQGSKALRSSKMDDVIFAGSSSKSALGRAEVVLCIDNSSGLIPIGLSEITIKRTLFRSGDSEYFLNGIRCRLWDVQELLSDAGVGRQQHIIISQGHLDTVLNARPEDRRMIIEEASGILKFRRRKEKVQRRLVSIDQDFLRLKDIVDEVQRQLKPLKRQAKQAERYQLLVEQIEHVRHYLASVELSRLRDQLDEDNAQVSKLEDRQNQINSLSELAKFQIETARSILENTNTDKINNLKLGYETTLAKWKSTLAIIEEKKRSLAKEQQRQINDSFALSLVEESNDLKNQLIQLDSLAADLVQESKTIEAKGKEFEQKIFDLAQEFDSLDTDYNSEVIELNLKLQQLNSKINRDKQDLLRLDNRVKSLVSRISQIEQNISSSKLELEKLDQEIKSTENNCQRIYSDKKQAESIEAQAEEKWRQKDRQLHGLKARVVAFTQALQEARAQAAQHLLPSPDLLGTLIELIDIEPGWETSFETAIAEISSGVVMKTTESAKQALESLRDKQVSGVILSLDPNLFEEKKYSQVVLPPNAHWLKDYIRAVDPQIQSLLEALLENVVVVKDHFAFAFDFAKQHLGLLVVTPQGDRFFNSVARTKVSSHKTTKVALEQAESDLAKLEQQLKNDFEYLSSCRLNLKDLRSKEANERSLQAQLQSKKNRLEQSLSNFTDQFVQLQKELKSLNNQISFLDQQKVIDAEKLEILEKDFRDKKSLEDKKQNQLEAYREKKASLDDKHRAFLALKNDFELRVVSLEQRRSFVSKRLSDIENKLELIKEEEQQAKQKQKQLKLNQIGLEQFSKNLISTGKLLSNRLEVISKLYEKLRSRDKNLLSLISSNTILFDSLQDSLKQLSQSLQQANIKRAEDRLRLDSAVEKLGTLPISEKIDQEYSLNLPEGISASNHLQDLEDSLQKLGLVNPLALEQYKELSERAQFLESQLEDIDSSRKELKKVIRAIDDEMSELFGDSFTEIAENFKEIFSMLFPGGQGRLILSESKELLESGIEVEAKPAGKNVKKLSLLSGGERSLAALAFLFSVFRSRPSPFYILDEVEAALDDVSLHRFLNLLNDFRTTSQLLVVTHQKRTMEAADCLVGVSMAPGGTSKVITQRMNNSFISSQINE